jgi:hypothetical protein
MIACATEIGEVGDRADGGDLRLAAWLAAFMPGGVGEEVLDHAADQRGELVQVAGGLVGQGGLHVSSCRFGGFAGRRACRMG